MANVFISYKRENLAHVQLLVQALEASGLDVWWDQDIAPDAPWEATIERELEAAKVVIVAWSRAAILDERGNVKAEARRARNRGKLIQTFVERCEPPLFFGERQGIDLSNWNGDANDRRFQVVLAAARAVLAGKPPPEGTGYAPKRRAPWAALTATFLLFSAVLSFIPNLGGARDVVCSLRPLNAACRQYGLISEPGRSIEEMQQALIERVSGTWGRLDRNCAETVTYRVEKEDEIYRIRGSAAGAFDSTMQVITIDSAAGTVTARATTPNEDGVRELWEYRPQGDVLAMRDPAGTETTLARCPET